MSAILSEGKTKIIRRGERPGEVVLETKDELTGGDAAKRETISGIAVWKTTQARNVFRLLQSAGHRHRVPAPRRRPRHGVQRVPHAAARAGDPTLRLGIDPQPRAVDREHAREAAPLRRAAARDLPQERGGDAAAPTEAGADGRGQGARALLALRQVGGRRLHRSADAHRRRRALDALPRQGTARHHTAAHRHARAARRRGAPLPRGPLDGADLRRARARLGRGSRPPTGRWRWST